MLNHKKSPTLQSTNIDMESESAISQSARTLAAIDQDGQYADEASVDDLDFGASAADFSAIDEARPVPRGAVLEFDDIGSEIEQFFAASGQRWCLQREFGSLTF